MTVGSRPIVVCTIVRRRGRPRTKCSKDLNQDRLHRVRRPPRLLIRCTICLLLFYLSLILVIFTDTHVSPCCYFVTKIYPGLWSEVYTPCVTNAHRFINTPHAGTVPDEHNLVICTSYLSPPSIFPRRPAHHIDTSRNLSLVVSWVTAG